MKILSLNLCATLSGHSREDRLQVVADFVEKAGVDILLLQEGVRCGIFYDTIRRLAGLLGFEHFARSAFGWPVFWEFRVGIISRFEILRTDSMNIEVPQTERLDAIPLPGRRRAVAVLVEDPGLGIVNLVAVHLTSSPKTIDDRDRQFRYLADFLFSLPGHVIVGGDFNTSLDNPVFGNLRKLGFYTVGASHPDFILTNRGNQVQSEVVLTQGVTDHAGGVLVEID